MNTENENNMTAEQRMEARAEIMRNIGTTDSSAKKPTREAEEVYFTIYWLSGDREVMKGLSIEDAFRKAGYGGGAVNAIDCYKEGVDDGYRWDIDAKTWVEKERTVIKIEDIRDGTVDAAALTQLIKDSTEVVVLINDQGKGDEDMLAIHSRYGLFNVEQYANMIRTGETKLQWVKYLEVFYLEYGGDNPFEDEEHDGKPTYYVCASTQFQHDDYDGAVAHFIERCRGDDVYRVPVTAAAKSIAEIAAAQDKIPL